MLNISNLERRWFIYKIKSFIPHIIIFISLIVILIVISIYNIEVKKNKKNHITKAQLHNIKTTKKIKSIDTKIPQQPKIILKPSYDFMKNIKETNNIRQKINIPKKQINIKLTDNKRKINIKRETTLNDITILLKRFNDNKNPALSLFISKKYYEQKEYKKSYKYAFITNELNNKIEDSWIIFIKSMVKLGRKEEAIKTLNSYIKHSHSVKGKILLNEIYSGKVQ